MTVQKVLIIIPCYNEEVALPMVLAELKQIKLPTNYSLHILVINDCSTDGTRNVAETHKTPMLDLPINLGIGGAVQSGLIYAFQNNFDIAIQLDGDGQHPPKELIKLLDCYQATGANIVIGSRFIENKGFRSSPMRRMVIRFFCRLTQLFTGVEIYDSTSGFRLFDKKAIAVGAVDYPDDYPEPESLILFSKHGLKIQEVAVVMSQRLGGKSSIRNFYAVYYFIKVTIAMFFSFIRKTN